MRRVLLVWLSAIGGVVLGGVVLGTGTAAATTTESFHSYGWSTVDATRPAENSPVKGDQVDVGAWSDGNGQAHVTKAYFTLGLDRLTHASISAASIYTTETSAADCGKNRATQLWITDPADAPTWDNPPAQRTRLPVSAGAGCPTPHLEWDALAAVQDAVAAGRDYLTLVLTMPDTELADPAFSRAYSTGLRLEVTYNQAPWVPRTLAVGDHPCDDSPLTLRKSEARPSAVPSDPNQDYVNAEFFAWPVDHPEQGYQVSSGRTASGTAVAVDLPAGFLVDGRTYDWYVRGNDNEQLSAWSPTCRFTVDDTAPATAPTVTSTDYPPTGEHGGPSVAGQFTFDAGGDPDIVKYVYGELGHKTFIVPDQPGGPVTVGFDPGTGGPHTLEVTGVDRAGNAGPTTRYQYSVIPAPDIQCKPFLDGVNVPVTCVFLPDEPNVVAYRYSLDGGAPQTVEAFPGGAGSATFRPQRAGTIPFVVTEVTGSGVEHSTSATLLVYAWEVQLDQLTPTPTVDQPMSVQASSPRLNDVTEYRYRLDDGAESTVAAAPDATATITVTPATPGHHTLTVTGTRPDGGRTLVTSFDFEVAPQSS